MNELPMEQQVRIKAMELTIDHFRGATIGNGNYLEPPQMITRAEQIEAYILGADK